MVHGELLNAPPLPLRIYFIPNKFTSVRYAQPELNHERITIKCYAASMRGSIIINRAAIEWRQTTSRQHRHPNDDDAIVVVVR
jgi:hypothetical protein